MNILKKIFHKNWNKTLVLSGGWIRWVYTLGVLKWLEELGIDKEIDSIFGVSVWAIIGSLWASGMPAEEIYNIIRQTDIWRLYGIDVFKKTWWLLSSKKIEKILIDALPKDFSKLKKKLYVGTVDTNKAQYLLLDKWDLPEIVLGSMSIPGIFPPVKYKNYNLIDGGVLNNFPVDIAKQLYPKNKIIGITLNKFEENQEVKSMIDSLMLSFEILMRSKPLANNEQVDYLFYKKIHISTLSLDKKKMQAAYDMGYQDCLEMFGE